jgi:hypothetical protein
MFGASSEKLNSDTLEMYPSASMGQMVERKFKVIFDSDTLGWHYDEHSTSNHGIL